VIIEQLKEMYVFIESIWIQSPSTV